MPWISGQIWALGLFGFFFERILDPFVWLLGLGDTCPGTSKFASGCWNLIFHLHPCFFYQVLRCFGWDGPHGILQKGSSCVSRGGWVHVQREDLMPMHPPSIFVLNGLGAHWTPLISGLCGDWWRQSWPSLERGRECVKGSRSWSC